MLYMRVNDLLCIIILRMRAILFLRGVGVVSYLVLSKIKPPPPFAKFSTKFSTAAAAAGGDDLHDHDFTEPRSLFGPRPESWWTGRSPSEKDVPGMREDGRIASLPQLNLRGCTKQVREVDSVVL